MPDTSERLDNILLKVSQSQVIDNGHLISAMSLVLHSALEGLNIKRASVWLWNDEKNLMHCQLLIDRVNGAESDPPSLSEEHYPNYFMELRTERAIIADSALTDKKTREFSDGYLRPLGISSMLDLPIRLRGEMVGIICCEHIGLPRKWTNIEATFAASLADLIGRAMVAHEWLELKHELEARVLTRTNELSNALDELGELKIKLGQYQKKSNN